MNAVTSAQNPNHPVQKPLTQPMGRPEAVPAQANASAMSAVARLGTQTRLLMNGSVVYNEPLVQQIVQMGPAAVPALQSFFTSVNNIPALLEGLYAVERLATVGVDAAPLVTSLARWNTHPDPLVQMNLARFYRKINNPGTFGPMLATLMNQATSRYATLSSPNYNVSQEVGATVLDQIANRTADVLMQRLAPFWQPLLLQQQASQKEQKQ